MHELLPREIEVLKTIIEDYIVHAQPVGSRTVAKQSDLRLSPASMRNVMADLTEKGFLEQPHTSAGRVPTVSAFRSYLDTLLETTPVSDDDARRIAGHLAKAGLELSDVLGEASKLVSSFSRQVGMIVSPNRDDVRWKEIGFSLLKPGQVLAFLILEGGILQNRLLAVGKDISADDLVTFSNYLNANYTGKTLFEARAEIHLELERTRKQIKDLYSNALRLARNTFENIERRELYVEGALNIMEHAQASDMDKMRDLLQLLEERSRLLDVLDRTIAEEGIKVFLGREAEVEELSDCSVITAPYGDEKQHLGVVSVIGPLRMNYAQVVPLVDYMAKALTHLLKHRF